VFLQFLVFTEILRHGHFFAAEHNELILSVEIGLTFFALFYFVYLYRHQVRSMR
jgi:hypothetical protein